MLITLDSICRQGVLLTGVEPRYTHVSHQHFCHKFSKKVVWITISNNCTHKSQVQLKTPQLEFILGKPYWSSSSRENSWWQLAMNFPRRFSRSDNLALVTETRHTSKQMLCSIVSFEWFLMKCDAKASVLPSYLLPRCEIPTFFFKPSL